MVTLFYFLTSYERVLHFKCSICNLLYKIYFLENYFEEADENSYEESDKNSYKEYEEESDENKNQENSDKESGDGNFNREEINLPYSVAMVLNGPIDQRHKRAKIVLYGLRNKSLGLRILF